MNQFKNIYIEEELFLLTIGKLSGENLQIIKNQKNCAKNLLFD